ncbi:hypothetical protein [Chryseobacterium gallinarum]|uniref:hypothetical protein n=1 Tax=Chryseobacterium gallinarum TaxID=1324352 RepID=UPI0006A7339B|nr:hypothetical protein [Chryseobacterium gallinarum]
MNGEFLRKKIESTGFQLVEIAEKLGITPQDLQSKLKSKDIKTSFLIRIAEAINKNVYFFFDDYYREHPINSFTSNKTKETILQPQIVTVDSHNNDNIVLVPHKLKAGYLTGYNNPDFIKKLPSYRMPGLNNGIFRMFEIEGNSMFPTLPNKSYVVGQFVENWEAGIKDNQVYAIISNEIEDGLVKRCINRINKYNNLICKSDNRRSYPTQNIDPATIKEVWEVKLHLNFQLPDPADIYDRMNDLEAELQEIKRKTLK